VSTIGKTSTATTDIGGRRIAEVRRLLGDYRVIDAKTDMIVYVNLQDQELGVPGDPNNCMFSRACKRAFGSHGVLFYPTVAYVDMLNPDDQDERVVYRFRLPKATRERLERFEWDRSHTVEASFRLLAIPKALRIETRRKNQKQREADIRSGKRTIDPVQSARTRAGAQKRKALQSLLGIRSGQGQIHTAE